MEKNFKACMLINNALSPEDVSKLQSRATAKEKWEALEQMYMGSSDLREVHRFNAKKEFYNFKMMEDETVSAYQSRFEGISTNLSAHGITNKEILDKEKILVIIDGLPQRHKMTKAILKESPTTLSLSLHEVFSKIQQYEDGESSKGASADRGIALKIDKALEFVKNNADDAVPRDSMTALITKAVRDFIKRTRNNRGEGNSGEKRDIKDVICYNCKEKGHYSNKCPKGNDSDEDKPKAFYATWGNPGEGSGEDEPDYWGEQVCAMAIEGTTKVISSEEHEVDPKTLLKSLESHGKNDLLALINDMFHENSKTVKKLARTEEECKKLKESLSINSMSSADPCESCMMKESEIVMLNDKLISQHIEVKDIKSNVGTTSNLELEVSHIKSQVQKIHSMMIEKKLKKEVVNFTEPCHGIGYESTSKGKEKEREPTLEELREMRDKELQNTKERNSHLEERVKVLEGNLSEETTWYANQTAHKIFLNQSKGGLSSVPDPNRAKQRKFPVPDRKYAMGDYYKLCWFCGNNGHVVKNCDKKKKFSKEHSKRRNNVKPNDVSTSSNDCLTSVDPSLVNSSSSGSRRPGSPKTTWVVKN
jgi:hypothetical protein